MTLAGADIRTIKIAFEKANHALRKAETSKIYAVARDARLARAEFAKLGEKTRVYYTVQLDRLN